MMDEREFNRKLGIALKASGLAEAFSEYMKAQMKAERAFLRVLADLSKVKDKKNG